MNNYLHGYIMRSGFVQGMALMILIIFGLGVWAWFMTIKLDDVTIAGNKNALTVDIRDLAALSPGETLFEIDTAMVKRRVEKHAWILDAKISRFPTGTLRIVIVERRPVLLALDNAGRQIFYLDRDGIRLPPDSDHAYDVPVFHGYTDGFVDTGETTNITIKELLRVLGEDSAGAAAYISEVNYDSEKIELRLEPHGVHGAVPVVLGSSEFEQKFLNLNAFWNQVMVQDRDMVQDQNIGWIDLRYDNQVVVRDAAP